MSISHPKSNGSVYAAYRSDRHRKRKNYQFFSKPNIQIAPELQKHGFTVTVCTELQNRTIPINKEDFEVNLWNLRIANKQRLWIKKSLFKAKVKIFLENLSTNESELHWRGNESRIYVSERGIQQDFRRQYLESLGGEYTNFGMRGLETADLMSELSREVYFLLTIKDSPFLYVKMFDESQMSEWDNERILNKRMRDNWLFQKMPVHMRVHLRVVGEGYSQSSHQIYDLDAKTWDDIQIVKY